MNKPFTAKDINYPRIYFTFLLLFIAALIITNWIIYISDGKRIAWGDAYRHLRIAYQGYYNSEGGKLIEIFERPISYSYAPLVYIVTFLIFKISGVSVAGAVLSLAPFIVIAGLSFYYTGKHYVNAEAGFLFALAGLSAPLVGILSRQYHLDFPLMAMVGAAFFFLLKSDIFKNRKFTYLCFAFCGLGMLTKVTFPAYMICPFLIVFGFFIVEKFKLMNTKERWKSAALIVSLLLSVAAGLWASLYLQNKTTAFIPGPAISTIPFFIVLSAVLTAYRGDIYRELRTFTYGFLIMIALIWPYYGMFTRRIYHQSRGLLGMGVVDIENPFHFLRFLAVGGIGIPLSIFLIIGIVYHLFHKRNDMQMNLATASFAGGLVILYLMPVTDQRYFVPLMAFILPVALTWLFNLDRIKRTAFTIILIYFCIIGWMGWSATGTWFNRPAKALEAKTKGAYSFFRPGPFPADLGEKAIADMLCLLSGEKKVLYVFISEDIPGGYKALLTIPVYLMYQHGVVLEQTVSLNEADWKRKTYITGRPGEYACRMMTDHPVYKYSVNYDCILIVYIHHGKNHVLLPDELREDLEKSRVEPRPDLVILSGKGTGVYDLGEEIHVIRIPLKNRKRNVEK